MLVASDRLKNLLLLPKGIKGVAPELAPEEVELSSFNKLFQLLSI